MRLVTFDLDGTLLKVRPTVDEALIQYGNEENLDLGSDARHAIIRWDREHWAKNRELINHDERHMDQGAFIEKHLRLFIDDVQMADAVSDQQIARIVDRFSHEYAPKISLQPEASDVLSALHRSGLTLGLVSNRDESLDGVAAEFGIRRFFDFTVAAGEVNSWKPHSAIYERALAMGGDVPPAQTVHVGDNYFTDVVGAQGVGIAPVLIDEEGAFPEVAAECHVISGLSELPVLFSR